MKLLQDFLLLLYLTGNPQKIRGCWRINFPSTLRGLTEQFQHCLFLWRSIKLHLEESFKLPLVYFLDLYFKPCVLFLIYAWKQKYCDLTVVFNVSQTLQVKNSWYLKDNSLKSMFTWYLIVHHFHSHIHIYWKGYKNNIKISSIKTTVNRKAFSKLHQHIVHCHLSV